MRACGSCGKRAAPRAARVWLDWHDDGARGSFLKQSAAEVLRQAAASGAGEARSIELDRLGRLRAQGGVPRRAAATLGLGDALAGIAYERACERGAIAVPAARRAGGPRRQAHRDAPVLPAQRVPSGWSWSDWNASAYSSPPIPDAYREEGRANSPGRSCRPPLPALTVNLFRGPRRADVGMSGWIRRCSAARRSDAARPARAAQRPRVLRANKLVGLLWPDSEDHARAQELQRHLGDAAPRA